jgi:hypothetical protein
VKRLWLCPLVLAGAIGCDDFNALGSCQDSGRCIVDGGPSDAGLTCTQDFYLQDAGEIPTGVWLGSGDDVWVGTQSNAIYHRQPSGTWLLELPGDGGTGGQSGVNAFWGGATGPSIAGGWNDAVAIYSGSAWQSYAPTPGSNIFAFYQTIDGALWVAAQADAFRAGGDLTNSVNWMGLTPPPGTQWQGVWGVGTDAWMVGLYSDGGTGEAPWVWHVSDAGVPQLVPQATGQLESIWGDSSGYFAVGTDDQGSALFCRLNSGWSCFSDGSVGVHAHGVWGRSASDVWATAEGNILHFNGGQWSVVAQFASPGGGAAQFYRMWGNAHWVWAAGNDALVHCP